MVGTQLIQLRLTSTIVKCANMITIECQMNNDSLHENVKNVILDTIFVIRQGC